MPHNQIHALCPFELTHPREVPAQAILTESRYRMAKAFSSDATDPSCHQPIHRGQLTVHRGREAAGTLVIPTLPGRLDVLLHEEAYSSKLTSGSMQEAMLQAASIEPGSLESLHQFLMLHDDTSKRNVYNDRFQALLATIPAETRVVWFNHELHDSMNHWGPKLRELGCKQALHFFKPISEGLVDLRFGQELLRSMQAVDKVFVQTELYRTRLERHFDTLNLNPRPSVMVFDLAEDSNRWEDHKETVSRELGLRWARENTALDQSQRTLVEQALESRNHILHRFVCSSSLDPSQGLHVVVEATRKLLDGATGNGATRKDLKRNFRFFFVHEAGPTGDVSRDDLRAEYAKRVLSMLGDLSRDFPGIVFACKELRRAPHFYPLVVYGCTGISGGAQHGFDHHLLRIATINENKPSAIVCGDGDGLAIRMRERGVPFKEALLPRAGSISEMARSLEHVVDLQRHDPEGLIAHNTQLLDIFVNNRKGKILADL